VVRVWKEKREKDELELAVAVGEHRSLEAQAERARVQTAPRGWKAWAAPQQSLLVVVEVDSTEEEEAAPNSILPHTREENVNSAK
jgi:hypothetical protein